MSTKNGKELRVEQRIWLKARPAKVWRAISAPQHLKRWYTTPEKLELKKGGRWDFVGFPGEVLEIKSGKKLVETHTFDTKKRPSRITFEVEACDKFTQLKVTHDRFGTDKKVQGYWTMGWGFILSNLKTYVETGAPMWETSFKGSAD